jgi:NADH:ubiquinone oxidoreductase subunit D
MPVRGDRFKRQRIRIAELNESIELMEDRKKSEIPSVIAILDNNINYCRTKRNDILQDMIQDGYKGEGL